MVGITISNDYALWGFLATFVSVLGGILLYRWAKPHAEKIEDATALAGTITAIGDAAVKVVNASTDVSEMMQGFLAPLKEDLDAQKANVIALNIQHHQEIEQLREEFLKDKEQCSYQLAMLSSHVQELRDKMRANGIDPGPPPELDGFQFD